MPPIFAVLPHAPFQSVQSGDSEGVNLDISGVAGFFGGDVAVSAMATVHIDRRRRWLGWYNAPGSYEIAKTYGQLARSRFWDGLYPGSNLSPEALFKFDGTEGPRYRGVLSGTVMRKTGHIAHLFLGECKLQDSVEWGEPQCIRKTTPNHVTVTTLADTPTTTESDVPPAISDEGNVLLGANTLRKTAILSVFPIAGSAVTCVMCGLAGDFFCCVMIALGMLVSGVSCFVIGSGMLKFDCPKPAKTLPPGDGVIDDGNHVAVLFGEEAAVNAITRGRFSLKYNSTDSYHRIGFCAVALAVQFLSQLLVVPQGTLFGQIMFLTSLGISWMYNLYLSSQDRENIQRHILLHDILQSPQIYKFTFHTRTATTIFTLLVLALPSDDCEDITKDLPVDSYPSPALSLSYSRPGFIASASSSNHAPAAALVHSTSPSLPLSPASTSSGAGIPRIDRETLAAVLDDLIPNRTAIWDAFKDDVLDKILEYANAGRSIPPGFSFRPRTQSATPHQTPSLDARAEGEVEGPQDGQAESTHHVEESSGGEGVRKSLSDMLYDDADLALKAFWKYKEWVIRTCCCTCMSY